MGQRRMTVARSRPSDLLLISFLLLFIWAAQSCETPSKDTKEPSPTPTATPTVVPTPTPDPNISCFETEVADGVTPNANVSFILRMTDPVKIQQARNILQGLETAAVHFTGTVQADASPTTYNPSWHFHLIETTITFFEIATEVCDAGARYVESHLSAWDQKTWCPWSSRLIREIACQSGSA